MAHNVPFVSCIVTTLNRSDHLVNTLTDLKAQDYPSYEIIVVDQSDTVSEATRKAVAGDSRINYIHVNWKGLTRARNEGARHAQGEILLYTDDDVHVEPDFIVRHVEAYAVDDAIGGVTGAVTTPNDPNPIGGSFVTWLAKVNLNRFATKPGYVDSAFGCNMSYRKSAWEKVGGFSETMLSNNLEETYFSFKLRRKGYKIYYTPKAVTLHYISPSGGVRNPDKRIQWYYSMFFNQFFFFRSFFSPWLLPLFLVSKARPIVACMFYYGRGNRKALGTPWRALADALKAYRKESRA